MQEANTLSYTSHFRVETGSEPRKKVACKYRVRLKKPNYFRMETQAVSGEQGGILIGDGDMLWIHWPNGRPKWENVNESDADEKTRFTSYITKPAPLGRHSISHEAIFLGAGMVFPILEPSIFHGYVEPIVKENLDSMRCVGSETIDGEACDLLEISLADHQRSRWLWLSKRDHLPRKLKEIVRVSYDHVVLEEWSSVVLNKDIPKSVFTWKPPTTWNQWVLPDGRNRLLKQGSTAPDFELSSLDGKPVRLSDFQGKTVLLCFWRVGCPPCRKETPYLQDLYKKHMDKGLVVLGVNVWDDKGITSEFLRKHSVTFPNILDASENGNQVYLDYGEGPWPTNYLIDRDGIVIDAWFGFQEVKAKVAAALHK
jgi:peroxiredoxin/outer membrane lipoprotein-sorting protein